MSPSWLGRLREGNRDAWQRLTELYGPAVYRWCRRAGLSPEDADDVRQEVFRAAAVGLPGFRKDRPSDSFGAWLRGITRHKLLDHHRRESRQPHAPGGTSAQARLHQVAEAELSGSTSATSPYASSGSTFRHALAHIRSAFEERTWLAFWRVAVDGVPTAEVAIELGLSPGAVYIAKCRVLRRFRDEFGDLID